MLIAIGFVAAFWAFIKAKNREPLLLFSAWFLLPALLIVVSRSALYDNARQLLFLWPPLFILAGIGMDWLISFIKLPMFKAVLLFSLALPGIFACIQLHPYEYVYYNSLTGGVKGAYRNYELDYWATSFKESMEYLNAHAEEGATIVVIGTRPVAKLYARPDLVIVGPKGVDESESQPYYILASTRANKDLSHCSNAELIFSVERSGGVLSTIRKVMPGQICK